MSLRTTFRTSLDLGRERLRRAPRRIIGTWVLQALVLLVLAGLLPGIELGGFLSALLAAAVIGGLNALVRPVIVVLTLPLTVATFGLLSLLINTALIVLAAPLVPGMEVDGFLPALSLAVVFTVVTTTINVVLAVDEDESFYEELTRRMAEDMGHVEGERAPGLVMIQIDGLAAPILRNAIRVGTVPRMASWVRSGAYTLTEWECPPPSQTSASQAGILHGDNDDIPAFRWFEKETGRLLVSNHPADAAEIERRRSDGAGLLHPAGTSVGNLFSGDAQRNAFVMSRMGDPVRGLDVDAFSLYFVDPAAFIRTLVLGIGEFVKELVEARRQRVQDIQPRVHRGTTFAFLRAATNVVLRDLNTTFVVRSMALGVPTIYVDFTDYDEIAHHAGPERLESLRALTGVDRVITALERAAQGAPRDYRFVLLSDHGQSQGATFLQRYGQTLEQLVLEHMKGGTVTAATGEVEAWGPVNVFLGQLAGQESVSGRIARRAIADRDPDAPVGPDAATGGEPASDEPAEITVVGSGNLGGVWFSRHRDRQTAADIEEAHPGLLAALAAHPGIGFAVVLGDAGPVALGEDGTHDLVTGEVVGVDPLALFGPDARGDFLRVCSFDDAPDIYLNSLYDPVLDEVAAFEELVGCHGGLGGWQTRPLLVHPAEWQIDADLLDEEGRLRGAESVHHQFVRWLERLGQREHLPADVAGAEASPPAAAADPPEVVR